MCVCVCSEDVVRVRATVIEHNKTAKVIVFKKKRRKNYKRTKGQTIDALFYNYCHPPPPPPPTLNCTMCIQTNGSPSSPVQVTDSLSLCSESTLY